VQWLLYANKFGEVLTVPVRAATADEVSAPLEPAGGAKLVLAHCSTIVTAMLTSDTFIVTADREEKVRNERPVEMVLEVKSGSPGGAWGHADAPSRLGASATSTRS
jgi:hypothetical protein